MKIQVVREDGNTETLELIGTLHALEPTSGAQGGLLIDSTGTTHFFRAEDGVYDGWGMEVGEGMDEADVRTLIEAVERNREVHRRDEAR